MLENPSDSPSNSPRCLMRDSKSEFEGEYSWSSFQQLHLFNEINWSNQSEGSSATSEYLVVVVDCAAAHSS